MEMISEHVSEVAQLLQHFIDPTGRTMIDLIFCSYIHLLNARVLCNKPSGDTQLKSCLVEVSALSK